MGPAGYGGMRWNECRTSGYGTVAEKMSVFPNVGGH